MRIQSRHGGCGLARRHVRPGMLRRGVLPGAIALLVAVAWVAACEDPVVPEDPIDPIERDRAALVALYEATDGENWSPRFGRTWLSRAALEHWDGVSVGSDGRVEALDLSRGRLRGTLPPELGDLTRLKSLNLRFNDLTGPIPPEMMRTALSYDMSMIYKTICRPCTT